jgi:Flp pilus assembly protein TadG
MDLQLVERAKMILGLSNATNKVALLTTDQRGVAAIEFALFVGFLSFAMLNVADISIYIYQRMEVENATEMGAQAAWKNCDIDHVPATIYCPGLTTAVNNAVHSTTLGTSVSLQSVSEGYYCVNSSNALTWVSDITSKPADCSAAGTPSLQPGDYIKINTTFTYAPLFSSITVANTFPTPITKTAWMRLE